MVVADVDDEQGASVAADLGDAAAFQHTDVSDVDQVQALVDFAVERFGGLHLMFNNAGIGSPLKRFLPDDLSDFTRIMNVNLFGVIAGSQRAARHMKDNGGGVDHQQRVDRRHQRRRRDDLLPRVEGGDRPRHQVHGHRPRAVRHPGQLPHAGPHPHRHHELRHGAGAEVHAAARAGGRSPTTSPTPWCSSPATAPRRSPGSCSRSTAGRRPARRFAQTKLIMSTATPADGSDLGRRLSSRWRRWRPRRKNVGR